MIFLDIMTQGHIILIAYASLCLRAYLGKGMTYFALRVLFGFVLCTLVYFFRHNDTRTNYPYFIRLAMPKGISWQRNDIFYALRTVWICTLVNFFRQNETKGQVLIFFNICLVETKVSSWQRMTDFQPVG